MLTNIPEAVNRMTRIVVTRHPNAYNCNIFRKVVNRPDPASGWPGIPTLGGMGVILADDEEDVSFEHVGDGALLQVDPFEASSMMSRQDANNGSGPDATFLIAAEDPALIIMKNDIVYRIHGNVVKQAFEIVDIMAMVNIPPYCVHYICDRRDDLHVAIV